MRTFLTRLATAAAALALGATVAVVAPVQTTALANDGLPLKKDSFSLWWNNVNDPAPTYCTRVKGSSSKLNLKMSKSLRNGRKMCDFYTTTRNNGPAEKTQFDIYKRSKWRIDVKVALGKKNSVVIQDFVNGEVSTLKITSRPYAMKFQLLGKKNSEWIPDHHYTFRNEPAKNFEVGLKYKITATYTTGPYKGHSESFISYMFLKVYPKLTK